jgi:hypothetical protein
MWKICWRWRLVHEYSGKIIRIICGADYFPNPDPISDLPEERLQAYLFVFFRYDQPQIGYAVILSWLIFRPDWRAADVDSAVR